MRIFLQVLMVIFVLMRYQAVYSDSGGRIGHFEDYLVSAERLKGLQEDLGRVVFKAEMCVERYFGGELKKICFDGAVNAIEYGDGESMYFLSSSDWLSEVKFLRIFVGDDVVEAVVVDRDDKENIALLRSFLVVGVDGAKICEESQALGYSLLEPGGFYEQLAGVQFLIPEGRSFEYAQTSSRAKNGYGIYSIDGCLLGMSVSGLEAGEGYRAVHFKRIERFLRGERSGERLEVEDFQLEER